MERSEIQNYCWVEILWLVIAAVPQLRDFQNYRGLTLRMGCQIVHRTINLIDYLVYSAQKYLSLLDLKNFH